MAAANTITSTAGVRLLLGLLAPYTDPAAHTDLAAAFGYRDVTRLHQAAWVFLSEYVLVPELQVKAGIWAAPPRPVPPRPLGLMESILQTLPSDGTAQAVLDRWVSAVTFGQQQHSPTRAPAPGGLVAMSAVAVDDDWRYRATDTFDGNFTQTLPADTLTQIGDTLIVSNPLRCGLLVRVAVDPAGADRAAAALGCAGEAVPADPSHPMLSEVDLPMRSETPVVSVTLPNVKLSTRTQLAADAARWGIGALIGSDNALPGLGGTLPFADLLQVACAEMSASGFKAAAVTAARARSMPPQGRVSASRLVVDGPFAFVLDDPGNGTRLFEGTVGDLAAARTDH